MVLAVMKLGGVLMPSTSTLLGLLTCVTGLTAAAAVVAASADTGNVDEVPSNTPGICVGRRCRAG